jgi:FeS assembly SUF system regulator
MLRIGKLADYATVLMTRMSHGPDALYSAPGLASELGLPAPTVTKLLKLLANAGLLVSQRGVAGGYALARKPARISVAEVVSAVEGPVALTACAQGRGNCALESSCATRANWRVISRALRAALEAVSLADMAAPMSQTLAWNGVRAPAGMRK